MEQLCVFVRPLKRNQRRLVAKKKFCKKNKKIRPKKVLPQKQKVFENKNISLIAKHINGGYIL